MKRELGICNVKKSIKKSNAVELISRTITSKSKRKLVIGSYYRPPARTDKEYLDNSRNELLNLKTEYKQAIFVLGSDFD